MIVDALRTEERDGTLERSARVRWADGGYRLRFSVPTELSGSAADGSPFLTACLLQAMRRREDLEIDAPVSPRLLAATDRAQTIYRCWAPSLRRAAIKVAGEAPPREPAIGTGCFFSRGVDSMYSAAAEGQGRVSHLIFISDLDPINSDSTRAEEVRLAKEAAALLGQQLVLARTNLRRMADRLLDWADLVGAGLSAVGQCLEGGLGQVLIPASCDWATFGPCGSSPVLDYLFSTEAVEVEHGAMGEGRHGKVCWLARERAELLPLLKVCYRENRPDNCGKCRKCLWTMVCLEAAGALEPASGFPSEIDPERIRAMRLSDLPQRLFWLQAADAVEAADSPRVGEAIRHALHRSAHPSLLERARARYARLRGREPEHDPAVCRSPKIFYRNQTNAALSVLRGNHSGWRAIDLLHRRRIRQWTSSLGRARHASLRHLIDREGAEPARRRYRLRRRPSRAAVRQPARLLGTAPDQGDQ